MAQSVYNIAEAVKNWGSEYLALVGYHKYFPVMNAESHVFFVNGSTGSNSADNNGQTPDTPLLTITAALGKCTSDKNDYIFILDYYQATGETWPISISKKLIHIIGISGAAGPYPWVQPTGDTAAFVFASGSDCNGCEIAGLELGAGATHGCIEVWQGGNFNIHIHDCGFGTENGMTGKYGIRVGDGTSPHAGEMLQWLIENNRFGAKLTASGIEVATGTYVGPNSVEGTVIRNNFFHVSSGDVGINVTETAANFADGGIFNNHFNVAGATTGEAITFGAGTKGVVSGNVATYLDNSGILTSEPYNSGADGMSWGPNYESATLHLLENDYITE